MGSEEQTGLEGKRLDRASANPEAPRRPTLVPLCPLLCPLPGPPLSNLRLSQGKDPASATLSTYSEDAERELTSHVSVSKHLWGRELHPQLLRTPAVFHTTGPEATF